MKIYIASSWKNQHAVEMLTTMLRKKGHKIISFVEKAVSDEGRSELKSDVDRWIASEEGYAKFEYDIECPMQFDLADEDVSTRIKEVLLSQRRGLNEAYLKCDSDLSVSINTKFGTSPEGATSWDVNVTYIKDKVKLSSRGSTMEEKDTPMFGKVGAQSSIVKFIHPYPTGHCKWFAMPGIRL